MTLRRGLILIGPLAGVALLAGLVLLPDRPHPRGGSAAPYVLNKQQKRAMGRMKHDYLRLRDPSAGRIPGGIRAREQRFVKEQLARADRTQEWVPRGPWQIGGRTRGVAVDVAQPNRLIAGGTTGGIWISEGGLDSWTFVSDRAAVLDVTCIAQDVRPGHTSTWYCGTGEYYGTGSFGPNSLVSSFGYVGTGIHKSTDNGWTWQQLASTATPDLVLDGPFDVVFRVATNPANLTEDELLAATHGTIHHSVDGGESWDLVLGSFLGETQILGHWTDAVITPDGVMYASLSSAADQPGIFRSTDGETWEDITPPYWPSAVGRAVLGAAPSNSSTLYVIAHTPGTGFFDPEGWDEGMSLWCRRDGVWEDLTGSIPYNYVTYDGYAMYIRVHPDDENMVFLAGVQLYRSTNGFSDPADTRAINGGHLDHHEAVFDPYDTRILYASNDGGVSKVFDCTATPPGYAIADDRGYITTQYYSAAVNPIDDGNTAILGGTQDNGSSMAISDNLEDPWLEVDSADGLECAIGYGYDDRYRAYYTSWQNGLSLTRTTMDPVYHAVQIVDIMPPGNYALWFTPFKLDPANWRSMYLAQADQMMRNPDAASTGSWEPIPGASVSVGVISAIGVSTEPAHVVYYAESFFQAAQGPNLYRITDALDENPRLATLSTAEFAPGCWIHGLTVDPADADRVIAVVSNYGVRSLFYSQDGGLSWTSVGGNLEQYPDGSGNGPACFDAAITHVDGTPFYLVGTSAGLYSTTALQGDVTEWSLEGPDVIGLVRIEGVDVRHADGYVGVCSHGVGAYSCFLRPVAAVETTNARAGYALNLTDRNPVRGRTALRLQLPRAGHLQLRLFDENGRLVRTLADGELAAGEHHFGLDGSHLASGVYFIRASVPGRWSAEQKVTVIR